MKELITPLFVSAILLAASLPSSQAGTLGLHDTGEGLTQGDPDPNWTVILPDGTAFGSAISATDPNGAWISPTPPNTWISVVGRSSVPIGVYKYTTTFSIDPGADLSTALISGHWWSDEPNLNNGIYLNGVNVSTFEGAFWFDTDPANALFSVTSGFVTGLNSLTFYVENTGGPGGTLIQDLRGSIGPSVPEGGATIFLLALSLACVAGLKRKASAASE